MVDEFDAIIRFWLEFGVDGFRIDVAQPESLDVFGRWRRLCNAYGAVHWPWRPCCSACPVCRS